MTRVSDLQPSCQRRVKDGGAGEGWAQSVGSVVCEQLDLCPGPCRHPPSAWRAVTQITYKTSNRIRNRIFKFNILNEKVLWKLQLNCLSLRITEFLFVKIHKSFPLCKMSLQNIFTYKLHYFRIFKKKLRKKCKIKTWHWFLFLKLNPLLSFSSYHILPLTFCKTYFYYQINML